MHPQIFDMVDEKSREKCLKEIRLVQSLTHDNIIKYIDAFIENHELMLIFEYAEVRVHCICMHAACGGTHKRLDCVGGVRERALDVRVVSVVTRPPPSPLHLHTRPVTSSVSCERRWRRKPASTSVSFGSTFLK